MKNHLFATIAIPANPRNATLVDTSDGSVLPLAARFRS